MKPARINRYRKTIPFTSNVEKCVRNGALVLQPGQWVKLPWLDYPSRWVGLTRAGSIWMVHTDNGRMDGGMARFKAMIRLISH